MSCQEGFGGRSGNTSAYVKYYNGRGDKGDAKWVFQSVLNQPSNTIVPGNNQVDVLIPKDLIVQGKLINPSIITTSDINAKEQVSLLDKNVGETILDIAPVTFQYKDDIEKKNHYGFIAQDFEEVLPELVNTDRKGVKGINLLELIPLLVLKIQDLQDQIYILEDILFGKQKTKL